MTSKQAKFVLATEGVGGFFVAIFLTAYFGGLPATSGVTTVLHSEPIFRIPLAIVGTVALVLSLLGLVAAALMKKK